MKLKTLLGASLAALAVTAAPGVMALQYNFSTVHSGATPGGSAPYATVTITQVESGKVSLKLEALSLLKDEFISFFKYNISGDASKVTLFAEDDGSGGVGAVALSDYAFKDKQKNDAGLDFDAWVNFPTSNSNKDNRFQDDETFEFVLSRKDLTVNDIELDMMIHIQGIGPNAKDSSKVIATRVVTVPDSGSMLVLLGVGLLGVARLRKA